MNAILIDTSNLDGSEQNALWVTIWSFNKRLRQSSGKELQVKKVTETRTI